jgi:hypothetical protein
MTATTALLCQFGVRDAVELSATLFRKQVLPLGSINYKGRTITFDQKYLTDLAAAYKDMAYDQVAFMLAGPDNAHTMDVKRFGGEVKGVEVTNKGLDVILDLTPDAAELVRLNPKLGVSARIIEGLERGDGKKYPRALQHVLGTLDPRVTGMSPWQEVSLSEEVGDTIDISNEEVTTLSEVLSGAPPTTGAPPVAPVVTPLQTTTGEVLAQAITPPQAVNVNVNVPGTPAAPAAPALGTSRNPAPVPAAEDENYEDVDVDQALEALRALPGAAPIKAQRVPIGASLSGSSGVTVDTLLAADQAALERIRTLELQLSHERFENEAKELVAAGVPPVMVELARPILELPAAPVIDLSNDQHVDMAQLVREMLAQTKGFIELSRERGSTEGQATPEAEADRVLGLWKGGKR